VQYSVLLLMVLVDMEVANLLPWRQPDGLKTGSFDYLPSYAFFVAMLVLSVIRKTGQVQ
jgi:NADH:ubiquinone oxidoreductase subunit 3 (subunit A)